MLGELNFAEIEKKWQNKWEEEKIYHFDEKSNKKIYSIDSPPPFTSGKLHMGHVLSYAYFDFLARYKRMNNFNVLYPQGWDCQGFPTELKVEKKYGRGLGRDEFKKKCVEWTEEFIGRMKEQMKMMGFSPDWRYEYKTMSPEYHRKVQYSLLKMYEDKLVYRGEHPVFWCVDCGSAIAKAETEELERETWLNFLKFKREDGEGEVIIATTRPELLHACVAVIVNPTDDRYSKLVGKKLIVPIYGQKVEVKTDAAVDKEFGTGIVMLCTFGDKQDVIWAYKFNLPIIKPMDVHGRLINAGKFNGMKVFDAKEAVVDELTKQGYIDKRTKLKQVIKIHDRCKKAIEFLPSTQYFIKQTEYKEKIVDAAKKMKWIPSFTLQYLLDWADNLEWDWVISRDRIFGTPLPFWICEKCNKEVPADINKLPVDPALNSAPIGACPSCGGKLIGEKATCDCWVDSSITPLVVAGWPDKTIDGALPVDLRPQGTEIIRTWAFYTIFRTLALTGMPPFKNILIHGMILGPDGKKMSKSLGNVVEPNDVVEKFSADAVRQWAAMSGALAKDRPFSDKDALYARNFMNKLWNASKFIQKSIQDYQEGEIKLEVQDKAILSKLNKLINKYTKGIEECDFYTSMSSLYEYFWHEFCDYYIEGIKHRIYQPENETSKRTAQFVLKTVLENSLKLLAPISPHITEEIYREIYSKKSIHLSEWPVEKNEWKSEDSEKMAEMLNVLVSEIRKYKGTKKIPLNGDIEIVKIKIPQKYEMMFRNIERDLKAITKTKNIELNIGETKGNIEKYPEIEIGF